MRIRLAVVLVVLPVGCGDEDTNSALGSIVEIGRPGEIELRIEDTDGTDGVIVDCSSLFASNVSIESDGVIVSASFPADTPIGASIDLPTGATVSVTQGVEPFEVASGTLVVDASDNGLDLRVGVTLQNVTARDGRVVNGTIDCLETNEDSISSSCAAACARGGSGGGGDDFDSD